MWMRVGERERERETCQWVYVFMYKKSPAEVKTKLNYQAWKGERWRRALQIPMLGNRLKTCRKAKFDSHRSDKTHIWISRIGISWGFFFHLVLTFVFCMISTLFVSVSNAYVVRRDSRFPLIVLSCVCASLDLAFLGDKKKYSVQIPHMGEKITCIAIYAVAQASEQRKTQ